MKVNQPIKKSVKFPAMESEVKRMLDGGYRLNGVASKAIKLSQVGT